MSARPPTAFRLLRHEGHDRREVDHRPARRADDDRRLPGAERVVPTSYWLRISTGDWVEVEGKTFLRYQVGESYEGPMFPIEGNAANPATPATP